MEKEQKPIPTDLANCQKEIATKYGLGTRLVTGHKSAYFNEATLLFTAAKDKRIEELEKELERRTELLENEHRSCRQNEYLHECYGLNQIFEMVDNDWQEFKETHNINQ